MPAVISLPQSIGATGYTHKPRTTHGKFYNKGENKMKIGVSAQEATPDSPVDPRFGRSKYFMIFDDTDKSWEIIDNKQNLESAQGAGIQSAATVVNAGCEVLISGHCGPKAFTALSKAGVVVYTISNGSVQNAIDVFKAGKLVAIESANVEGHW
jgi:predicted Fe-Mo cluster-binding NifX family protein